MAVSVIGKPNVHLYNKYIFAMKEINHDGKLLSHIAYIISSDSFLTTGYFQKSQYLKTLLSKVKLKTEAGRACTKMEDCFLFVMVASQYLSCHMRTIILLKLPDGSRESCMYV